MCVCSSQRFGALVERVGRWNMERKEIQGDLGPERAVFVGILNKKKNHAEGGLSPLQIGAGKVPRL